MEMVVQALGRLPLGACPGALSLPCGAAPVLLTQPCGTTRGTCLLEQLEDAGKQEEGEGPSRPCVPSLGFPGCLLSRSLALPDWEGDSATWPGLSSQVLEDPGLEPNPRRALGPLRSGDFQQEAGQGRVEGWRAGLWWRWVLLA